MANRSHAKKHDVLRKKSRQSGRRLLLQQLERRELLAGDAPRLISVNPNAGEIFDLEENNLLKVSPAELTFRFDGGQQLDESTLSGIRITRSGGDGTFGDGNEQIIQPGYLGFGDSDRVVIARFAEPLVDDDYRIDIFGFDQPAAGIVGLRNSDGELFLPDNLEENRQTIDFEIEIGALVTAVVPQPVETDGNGVRVQRRDQIHVYFNSDPLKETSAENPAFYKLYYTAGTVENTDDGLLVPSSVEYDATINRAVLTFADDLSNLLPLEANGAGTLRLRIGTSEALPMAPTQLTVSGDESISGAPGDTFASARPLGPAFGAPGQSVVIDSEVAPTEEYLLSWPGASDEPGIRDIRRNSQLVGRADTEAGITTLYYNFKEEYGEDPQGNRLDNAITAAQKQRVREALDLYEQHLGLRFVETADLGLQFVTGDMRAIEITADVVEGGNMSIYRSNDADPGNGLLILDGQENFFDGYGQSPDPAAHPSYFLEVLRGIGSLLGVGDTFEQPPGTASGSEDQLQFAIRPEPDFLSQSDITAGQHLFRPEGRDIDLYSFSVPESGRLTAETFAERLAGSSLLDTSLTLWRKVDGGGPDDFELVARNDDFYSNDSFVGIDVTAGDYVVGVSASGNDDYNPAIEGSGLGGRSQGKYQLRLVFQAADNDSIVDTADTPIDGDADGVAGGSYNFWFRTARPADVAATGEARTIFVAKDGSDTPDGTIDAPYKTITQAMAAANAGDIVRLLPNAGSDDKIDTLGDNLAYEIGKGGVGNQVLQDGQNLEVKRGVTVMIDAGSILKLRGAQITTGSSSVDTDRSQSALQVLGTPILVDSAGEVMTGADGKAISGRVIFTSYDDQNVGFDTNPLQTTPSSGQWGGLSFRNDVDYAQGRPVNEAEGIFLNYVGQADIRYGGGTVGSEPVMPIHMSESRPAIKYNIIRDSADAAMSADPNSFEETNFHAPVYQRAAWFTSDYDRVGPDLAGNRFVNNTINGLFVRIDTPTVGQLEPMTVSGRFDDANVTHVISQVLILQGTPGGPQLQTQVPSVLSVTVDPTAAPGGSTPTLDGNYKYRLTFVDVDGSESLASDATRSVSVNLGQAVRLANIPAAPSGFVGRRLYRLNAAGDYEFVAQLNRSQGTYVDTGVTRGGLLLQPERPDVTLTTLTPAANPNGLTGTYSYRLTFVDGAGNETLASLPTRQTTVVDQAIQLNNLPNAPSGYVAKGLYRLDPGSGEYRFVTYLSPLNSSFTDIGYSLLETLDPTAGSNLRPRYDARLSVDPGVVVKLQTSRIEATFGADFYAEGVDGREVIFTSRQDDRYGAGGTFDTNNDGRPQDGGDAPNPGDWGGLVFGQGSDASLDYALITYGGGETPTEGAFASFNAVEVVQSNARIAHTTFENNADGLDVDQDDSETRGGHGFNDSSTLFVRGAQPIIIDNVFRDNVGAAISINPDALDFSNVTDRGRATGGIDRLEGFEDNQGPLVRLNQLDGNGINGMVVRAEVLSTESIWDDTDIVHVVGGNIITVDHHYKGGLRLESSPGESLVVKVMAGAQLWATGRPLDIDDRIGGTLQIVGQPGFPVVLTSINDDSVGAGFAADGRSQNDTDGDGVATPPQPGDWQGIVIDSFANDRNVQVILENEPALPTAAGQNAVPGSAQRIGVLAKGEKAGDENERLGFSVNGTLSEPGDVDVYSFRAAGGTEVWIDLDRTTYALDSVVELIDQNGNITVLSNDSFSEASAPGSIYRDAELSDSAVHSLNKAGKGQIESPNPGDAGFRVVLPGAAGVSNVFYVRVRSSNLAPGDSITKLRDESQVREGRSQGSYRLGIRLREIDEIAGSTVQFADIRYAVNGIDLVSAPLHSPLAGEAGEQLINVGGVLIDQNGGNLSGTRSAADPLGNLLSTDRAALYVTGEIGNQSVSFSPTAMREDVDVFRLDLFYDSLKTETFGPNHRYVPLTFDVDYADALGRVNTSISIYNAAGQLILTGRDSNIAGDVGTPLRGVDSANLTAGSAGVLDAHIGPVELPEGVYYVAVHSDMVMPAPLGQFPDRNATSDARLMPINSSRTIFMEDFDNRNYTADRPLQPAFDFANGSIVPYTLEDVTMFVALDQGAEGGSERTTIATFDPFTGTFERVIGETGDYVRDLAMRGDGELYSYSYAPQTGSSNSGNVGNYLNISTEDGRVLGRSDDGLTFRRNNSAGTGLETDTNAQFLIHAMAYDPDDRSIDGNDRVYVVGERDNNGRSGEVDETWTRNIMYSNVATTGATTNNNSTSADDRAAPSGGYGDSQGPASVKFELGMIDTGNLMPGAEGKKGTVTGLAVNPHDGSQFFAVDDNGGVYLVDRSLPFLTGPNGYNRVLNTTYLGEIAANPNHLNSSNNPVAFPEFSGLTWGPRSVEEGKYSEALFATTLDGWMYGIEIDGLAPNASADDLSAVPAPIFHSGASSVVMRYTNGTRVSARAVGLAFSTLEENPWHVTDDRFSDPGHGNYVPYDKSRWRTTNGGGNSLYFGFKRSPQNVLERAEGDTGSVAPGGAHGSVVTLPFSLSEYSSADKPTVYFDYFLDTVNQNSGQGNEPMEDSFRVFASGDDGQWRLLATNDSVRDYVNSDEYDYYGLTGIPVQELHDDTNKWRQARIDISPMAGNSQVRLRFDFATVGATNLVNFRAELQTVAGSQLTDGDLLRVQTPDPNANPLILPNAEVKVFEIDLGYVINVPTGAEINDGESLMMFFPGGPQTITFRNVVTGPNDVLIDDTMTSAEVADAIMAVLDSDIHAVRFGQASIGLTDVTNLFNNVAGVVVSSEYGTDNSSATPIRVRGDMTAEEVAEALRDAFVVGLGTAEADIEDFKIQGNRAILYNHTITDAGPFGLSTYLPGDEFGGFSASVNDIQSHARTLSTEEGVYVDHLIVGFAERGEMVINAPIEGENLDFIRNPESIPVGHPGFVQSERPDEVLTGAYALEIRPSAEYTVPDDDFDPLREVLLDERLSSGRSIDTNDRLDDAVTLIAQSGNEILDGDTFVLTDGTQQMTFEFDSAVSPGVEPGHVAVPYDPRVDDAIVVAEAIRDAINSPQVQSVLDIRAESNDSREVGTTTSKLVNLFGDYVLVNPSPGRNLKVDLIKEETFRDRITAQTMPHIPTQGVPVQYLLEPDTFARAVPTEYINGQTDTLVAVGKIGDRVTSGRESEILGDNPRDDIDRVKIHLFAGDEIDIDIDAITTAKGMNQLRTPVLKVYNSQGGQIAYSRDPGEVENAPGESVGEAFLRFTAPEDGYYFVEVSSEAKSSPFVPRAFGEYQLTIRPSSDRADVLYVDYHMDKGDLNRVRDQGQIVIASNVITDSAQWGITATAGDRDVANSDMDGTGLPKPGNARLLRNENAARLLPGTVITNNLIVGGGSGGIQFAGDASPSGSMQGGVPFGRIVNNTVVGRTGGGDIGIDVGINASPTVMNNVISGFDTGLRVNGSTASQTTVVGGNIYKTNGVASNFSLGNQSFDLDNLTVTQQQLFTDAANGIYIPADGSLAIDSSFASLPDRQQLVDTVKEPSGISNSPIVAPGIDAYGQPRVDDPTVETPAGVGANVFIDRGALDRADFFGPLASIAVPTDYVQGQGSITVGGDVDGAPTFIRLSGETTLDYFEFQLLEQQGSGPNDATVLSEAIVLTENGQRLIAGVDYNFGYSDASNTIRLTPLSGIWRPDSAYEVTMNNRDRIVIQAPSGNEIVDGDQIVVTDENGVRVFLEFETGYVLNIPQTLTLAIPFGEGGPSGFRDGDQFEITAPGGVAERFELNVFGDVSANVTEIPISSGASATQIRDAILAVLQTKAADLNLAPVALGSTRIQLGSLAGHAVETFVSPMLVSGVDRGVTDGDTLIYDDGTDEITFEFTSDASTRGDTTVVNFDRTDTPVEIAVKLATAMRDSDLNLVDPRSLGDGRIHLGGTAGDILDTSASAIGQTGMPQITDSYVLQVADAGANGFVEGDQFSITHNGVTTLFEFTLDRDVAVGAEPITLTAGESAADVAIDIAQAIANANIGLTPTADADGNVRLNEAFGYELDLLGFAADPGAAALTATGVPGGAVPVSVVPTAELSPDAVAALLASALRKTPSVSRVFTPGGGSLWFSGTTAIDGIDTTAVDAIRDLAGNRLQPNRANEETQFTILMPEVELDFGDAPNDFGVPPQDYGTSIADNGARHTLGKDDLPRLGMTVLPDLNVDVIPGVSDGADEDGLPTGGVPGLFYDVDGNLLGFLNPLISETDIEVVTTGSGLLDAWIDFNRDGDWNDAGEQVFANQLVLEGANRLQVTTPIDAEEGPTWARFRLSQTGNLGPHGVAIGGEVEDYELIIAAVELPVPASESYTIDEDQSLSSNTTAPPSVLDNDDLNGATAPEVEVVQDVQSGTLNLNPDGTFTYTPNPNFAGVDTFTYRISGSQTLPPPSVGSLPVNSEVLGTVTITVDPVNDAPVISGPAELQVLEDSGFQQIPWATSVRPGPLDALDELDAATGQTVTLSIAPAGPGSVPAGLFAAGVQIDNSGVIRFTPVTDAVGSAVFVVTATDSGLNDPIRGDVNTAQQTVTIHVRPVNDAPRVDVPAPVRYTLLEDNTQFIPLDDLLAQFTVGPENEADATYGGNQTLVIDESPFPMRTQNGSVEVVRDGANNITGLLYTPDEDYNAGPDGDLIDQFLYSVTDDGMTFRTLSGGLEPDPLAAEYAVELLVEPVNDAPSFAAGETEMVRFEDEGPIMVPGWATDIAPGPLTAIDETDPATGQTVTFDINPATGYSSADLTELFAVAPSIDANGDLRFTPANDAVGTIVLEVRANDGGPSDAIRGDQNLSSPAVLLTITLQPVNDNPVADPSVIGYTLDEDHSIDLPLHSTDGTGLFDIFRVGPANEAFGSTAPGGGQSLSMDLADLVYSPTTPGGSLQPYYVGGVWAGLRYTPNPDFQGTDSFIFGVMDDGQSYDPTQDQLVDDAADAYATVSLTINPVNDRPQFAGAANVTVSEDAGATGIENWVTDILAGPATAKDENLGFTPQAVTFEVTPVSGTPWSDLFTAIPTVNQFTGELEFTTRPDANGSTVFEIVAEDNGPDASDHPDNLNRSEPRRFTIAVTAVNDAPTFTPGPDITIQEDNGPYNSFWANDISPGPLDELDSGQAVSFDVTTSDPSKFSSQPTLSDQGLLQFTPAENASGNVEVYITARDTDGAVAAPPYTLSLSITATNDIPVAVNNSFATNEDTILTLTAASLLGNDTDADLPLDTLSITGLSGVSQRGATVTLSADGSTVTYDPTNANAIQALRSDLPPGTDVFTYRVIDAAGATSNLATVTLSITGINDAPVARPDAPVLHPTNPTTFYPLANDSDADGTIDPTSIVITLQPAFGSLEVSSDGAFTYTPLPTFTGSDQIRYAVRDDQGQISQSALIQINVNFPPTAVADSATGYRNEPLTINVLANDRDSDGSLDPATVEIVDAPAHGQTIVNANGTITFVPAADFAGNDAFTYRVSDNGGTASNVATVSLRLLPSRLQNPDNALDVDDSGEVSPIDALLVINYLNRGGSSDGSGAGDRYLDVDGDGQIGPLDALRVINALNRAGGSGEGEATPEISLRTAESDASDRSTRFDSPETLGGSQEAFSSEWDFTEGESLADDRLDNLLDELASQRDESSEEGSASLDAVWERFGER